MNAYIYETDESLDKGLPTVIYNITCMDISNDCVAISGFDENDNVDGYYHRPVPKYLFIE